jgi:glycerophosphoryl diester phosphodiesterase
MEPLWPYPFWIAHRGAGHLAPENTLAAMRAGQALGSTMAECDVTLSADGLPFLLHDATLERTTNGRGLAMAQPWSALRTLDAGAWHGPDHAGERLASLSALAAHAKATGLRLNLEIKPGPGDALRCGRRVAEAAARLWEGVEPPPLLSAFEADALQAAREAAPGLPRALLFERLPPDGLAQARALGCVAVVVHHAGLDAGAIAAAHAVGLRVLTYTVNEEKQVLRLRAAGIDGLITDEVRWAGGKP